MNKEIGETLILTVEELIPVMQGGSTCWWELVSPLTNIGLTGMKLKNYNGWVWFYAEKQDVSSIVFDLSLLTSSETQWRE